MEGGGAGAVDEEVVMEKELPLDAACQAGAFSLHLVGLELAVYLQLCGAFLSLIPLLFRLIQVVGSMR